MRANDKVCSRLDYLDSLIVKFQPIVPSLSFSLSRTFGKSPDIVISYRAFSRWYNLYSPKETGDARRNRWPDNSPVDRARPVVASVDAPCELRACTRDLRSSWLRYREDGRDNFVSRRHSGPARASVIQLRLILTSNPSEIYINTIVRGGVRQKENERQEEEPTSIVLADARLTMFSGLTNQVSNWMGKKPENGSETTPEHKPASPDAESGAESEKKNNTRYVISL